MRAAPLPFGDFTRGALLWTRVFALLGANLACLSRAAYVVLWANPHGQGQSSP